VRRFAKVHGLGNDFVLIESLDGALITSEQARRWCDRHRGIGADGVLSILPPRTPGAAIRMHLYNADGSVAEMCGNGLRCVVRYALERGLAGGGADRHLVVDTDAGLREGWWLHGGAVRVTLGSAVVREGSRTVEVEGGRFTGAVVSMGNPHFVVQARDAGEDLTALAARFGPPLERAFVGRSNVELFKRTQEGIELVVFERGAGLTQACGTGAGATVAAARLWGLIPPGPIAVRLPGGVLQVEAEAGAPASIEGEAVVVFDGVLGGGLG
jgi:diaminopimelate epimerase